MDKETKLISVLAVFFIAVICLGFFFLGRSSVHIPEPAEVKHDTTYVPAPYPVHDTLKVPVPAKEVPPDTVYVSVPEPTDTAALFAVWLDYYTTREYNLDFSSDSLGVFRVAAKVNKNKLQEAISTIQPRIQVVTNIENFYKERAFQPWVMATTGVTDFKFQSVTVGVDINSRVMLGVGAMRYDKNGAFTINAGYKF